MGQPISRHAPHSSKKRLTSASRVETVPTAVVNAQVHALGVKKKGPSPQAKVLVVLVAILLIAVSLTRSNPEAQLDLADENTAFLVQNEETSRRMFWNNEWPSWLENAFCRGYVSSTWCKNRPLHPFRKQAELEGRQLNFPQEQDRRVVEQTYEIGRRGF